MNSCVEAWAVMKRAVSKFNDICAVKSSNKLVACKELAAVASETNIYLEQYQ